MTIIIPDSIFVHWNRHRKCWSMKDAKTKKLLWHQRRTFVLRDCTFVINEKARLKVIETRKRTVHAGVVGFVYGVNLPWPEIKNLEEVIYSPFVHRSFIRADGKPVKAAEYAFFTENGNVFVPSGNF